MAEPVREFKLPLTSLIVYYRSAIRVLWMSRLSCPVFILWAISMLLTPALTENWRWLAIFGLMTAVSLAIAAAGIGYDTRKELEEAEKEAVLAEPASAFLVVIAKDLERDCREIPRELVAHAFIALACIGYFGAWYIALIVAVFTWVMNRRRARLREPQD